MLVEHISDFWNNGRFGLRLALLAWWFLAKVSSVCFKMEWCTYVRLGHLCGLVCKAVWYLSFAGVAHRDVLRPIFALMCSWLDTGWTQVEDGEGNGEVISE